MLKICDKHGTYQGSWAMCPQCWKEDANAATPLGKEPIRLSNVGFPCPSCAAKDTRIAELEKVAEAAQRFAERPQDVAKLFTLRAALSAAGRGEGK